MACGAVCLRVLSPGLREVDRPESTGGSSHGSRISGVRRPVVHSFLQFLFVCFRLQHFVLGRVGEEALPKLDRPRSRWFVLQAVRCPAFPFVLLEVFFGGSLASF